MQKSVLSYDSPSQVYKIRYVFPKLVNTAFSPKATPWAKAPDQRPQLR